MEICGFNSLTLSMFLNAVCAHMRVIVFGW